MPHLSLATLQTREELINALTDAAELEHNLACLYLFAAFSLKTRPDEIQESQLRETVHEWQRSLLRVAKQEMGHLGTVCNLLTLIGGTPHFTRPNFPQPATYYPPDIPFTLQRFGLESLARFVEFERNADDPAVGLEAIAPTPVHFQHVGQLYQAIRTAVVEMDETALMVGPADHQDQS